MEESMVMVCPVRDRVDPVAAPIFGVVKVGVLAKTKDPVPVSSDITVISSAEVVAAKSESLFNVVVIVPVVGRVTFVNAVVVRVSAYAPEVVRFPPSVIVFVELSTPVPPFVPARIPSTCVVRPTFPHDGAVVIPPDINAFPVATSANFARVVAPDAYTISPTA